MVAAAALWVSFGTVGGDGTGARIALLPLDAPHLAAAAIAGACVLAIGARRARGGRVAAAVAPLLLLLAPWLPLRVPAAFLLWTGGLVSLVWMAPSIALGIAVVPLHPDRTSRIAPHLHARLATLLSAAIFSLAAWQVSPTIPGGDEPHYLVITQSLLRDGDLKIENNHRRGDYREYFTGTLQPDFLRRGTDREIYSIHAPGLPAIVLPAFAIGGYRGVVVFLIAVGAASAGLLWWLTWRVTERLDAAWFGWAAVALSAPYLLETFTVYPDGLGASVVLTGFWALLRPDWERDAQQRSWWPWLLHGLALATLPWMHTRFSVLAATLGGLALIRLSVAPNAVAKAIAFLAIPAVGAIAWLAFFLSVYGTPDPLAPYGGQVQNSFAFLPNGVGGLLFDQGFGLLASAPVLLVAFAGLPRVPRYATQWLVVATPYVLAVTTFAMWWAGWSAPARFFVPVLLPLGVPAAAAWAGTRSRGLRACALLLLACSLWLSAVLVAGGGGRLGFHARNDAGMTAAPWTDWAVQAVDLAAALPAFVPQSLGTATAARALAARQGFLVTVTWIVCGALATLIVVALARRLRHFVDVVALGALAFGMSATAAVAISWALQHAAPSAPPRPQLDLLRMLGRDRMLAIDLHARRRLTRDELVTRTHIEVPVAAAARAGARLNRPLVTIPALPAGEYRLAVRHHGDDGWIMAGVGSDRDPFSLITEPLLAVAGGRDLRLPVDVRGLFVRADEDARRDVEAIELQPLRILRAGEKADDGSARRAVRYGAATAFFMDEHAFAEPNAFWVAGGRETTVVLQQDEPSSQLTLILRNAPVANRVSLTVGQWRQDLEMAPGEERRVEIPVGAPSGIAALRLRSAAGFQPSDTDPHSRDTRFLGVYVTVQ